MYKKVAISLALAGLMFSGAATANTEQLSFVDGSAIFGHNGLTAGSAFDDYFTFSIPSLSVGDVAGSVTSTFKIKSGLFLQGVSINDLSVVNGSDFNQVIASGFDIFGFGGMGYAFSADDLASGNYALHVGGNALNSNSGYSGNVTLEVSPVPEPSSWMLMLSGLGMIGWMARRRSNMNSATFAA